MDKSTPLYDSHVELKGKIVPFAGYLLPVQYETGVITEHMAVRESAGLFDVSHMGEVIFKGKDALLNLQNLLTNDFSGMLDGRVRYSPMCNHSGGVVDDLIVYRINEEKYLVVVNAANKDKDVDWILKHLKGDVEFSDISDTVGQIALQGPKSTEILKKLVSEDLIPTKYYSFTLEAYINDIKCLISKTGYTGEDGFEIYCSASDAKNIWNILLETGKEYGLIPCGLGARDTLRLEAAMPLYGHELTDEITPLESALSMFVKFDKEDFIGKTALLAKGAPDKKRVGLKMIGRGIAREDCKVFVGDKEIGKTTSGTHCPYLGYAVAMAIIDVDFNDKEVEIEVRGRKILAEIVPLPFYKKKTSVR